MDFDMSQYAEFISMDASAALEGMTASTRDQNGLSHKNGAEKNMGTEKDSSVDSNVFFGDEAGSFEGAHATFQQDAQSFVDDEETHVDFGQGFPPISEIERKNTGSFVDSSSDNSWDIKTENVSNSNSSNSSNSSSSSSSSSLTDSYSGSHKEVAQQNDDTFSHSDDNNNINNLEDSLAILDGDDLLVNGSFIDRIALESFGAEHGVGLHAQHYGDASYQYSYDNNGDLVMVPVRPAYYNTVPSYQQYSNNVTFTKTKKKAKKASKSKMKRVNSLDSNGDPLYTPKGYHNNRRGTFSSASSSVSSVSLAGSVDSLDGATETPPIKRRGPGRPPNKFKKLALEESLATDAPPTTPRGGRLSSENVIMKLRRAQKEQEEVMLKKAQAAEERRVLRAYSEASSEDNGVKISHYKAFTKNRATLQHRGTKAEIRKLEAQMRPRIKGRFVSRKIYDDFAANTSVVAVVPVPEANEMNSEGSTDEEVAVTVDVIMN
jgi:hypothetical protein